VGSNISVDHIALDDNWLVKFGVWKKLTEVAISDEHDAVKSNRFAEVLKPVFDLGGIDYGRADHATIDGRTVVYEINTNPYIGPYVPDPHPLRRETQILARKRFAAALDTIDTIGAGSVDIDHGAGATPLLKEKTTWWRGSQLDVLRQLKASRAQAKRLEGELLRKTRAFDNKLEAKRSELAASRARTKRLEVELVRSQQETANLRAQLAAVRNSRSWRITAPMRMVFEFVQRNIRREKGC
jgi:hypothetical protein